jgi:hypothetical protein
MSGQRDTLSSQFFRDAMQAYSRGYFCEDTPDNNRLTLVDEARGTIFVPVVAIGCLSTRERLAVTGACAVSALCTLFNLFTFHLASECDSGSQELP